MAVLSWWSERDLSMFNRVKHDSHFHFTGNPGFHPLTFDHLMQYQRRRRCIFSESPPASEFIMPSVRCCPAAPEINEDKFPN